MPQTMQQKRIVSLKRLRADRKSWQDNTANIGDTEWRHTKIVNLTRMVEQTEAAIRRDIGGELLLFNLEGTANGL